MITAAESLFNLTTNMTSQNKLISKFKKKQNKKNKKL